MGKRRIEIEPIKDRKKLYTTFSKRRTGLFKKAQELCVLCGAQVAILTFSPAGKPYSYGHSSVDTVLNHLSNGTTPTPYHSSNLNHMSCGPEEHQQGFWWERLESEDVNCLDYLGRMTDGMVKLRDNLLRKLGDLAMSKGSADYGDGNFVSSAEDPLLLTEGNATSADDTSDWAKDGIEQEHEQWSLLEEGIASILHPDDISDLACFLKHDEMALSKNSADYDNGSFVGIAEVPFLVTEGNDTTTNEIYDWPKLGIEQEYEQWSISNGDIASIPRSHHISDLAWGLEHGGSSSGYWNQDLCYLYN